jgi:hypothetical protein
MNKHPTLVRAEISKQHIFGVFLSRQENEIALDPRRLRRFRLQQGCDNELESPVKSKARDALLS